MIENILIIGLLLGLYVWHLRIVSNSRKKAETQIENYNNRYIEHLREKNKQLLETIQKIDRLNFTVYDSLHNITSKEEFISRDKEPMYVDEALSQVRHFLSMARNLTNSKNISNDGDYRELLDFVEIELSNLGFERELFDADKLDALYRKLY